MTATEKKLSKAGIRIRQIPNLTKGEAYGASFMVTIPVKVTGATRLRKQFTTKERAVTWAEKQLDGSMLAGQGYFNLSEAQRADAVSAIDLLGASGLTLVEAVQFALPRLRPGNGITVSQAKDELITNRRARGKSERYLQDLESRLARFAEKFGDKTIASVTTTDIQQWLDGLEVSTQTTKNFRTVVGTLFTYAETRGLIIRGSNPVAATEKVSANGGSVEIYTPNEIARLLNAAPEQFKVCLAIGAFAGLRSAEIERLEWSDIDLQAGFITVAADKAKTASRRIVPISDNLMQWLAPYAKATGHVWRGEHRSFYEAQQETAAATEVKADTAKGIRAEAPVAWKANGLRHSYASYRLALTQNAAQVAMECGNSASVIFKHYRELVRPTDAEKWFAIKPAANLANVITLATAKA